MTIAALILAAERNTTQMRADADNHQPFRLLDPLGIGFRIGKGRDVDAFGLLDFLLRPVTNKDRLAAPLDRHDGAGLDCADVHFDGGERQR